MNNATHMKTHLGRVTEIASLRFELGDANYG